MIVGLTLICTRKYHVFLAPLLDDIAKHFFVDDERKVFLFTDQIRDDLDRDGLQVEQIVIPAYGFPQASLYRFRFFAKSFDRLEADYLFYSDVDMRFVEHIGHDMLPTDGHKLVGVHHSRCWALPGTWETDPDSNAYVAANKRHVYYAGGVFGGERDAFLSMAFALEPLIDEDVARGTVGVWHDESYLNWYFTSVEPTVLPPSYCFPPRPGPELRAFRAKILCLDKDHERIRS